MGLDFLFQDGNTPLSEEEKDGLLVGSISTHGELNELEQYNIAKAIEWTLRQKLSYKEIFSDDFNKLLHKKMFDEVWKWAGQFRQTDKNIGISWAKINSSLRQLNDDAVFWVENKTYEPFELVIRYKHRLVNIHCFPNGNGRHSRLMADLLISKVFGEKVFTWGRKPIEKKGVTRACYLAAIRLADQGDISCLLNFAKS